VNHTRFPKEDHPPDWARRENKVTKGDSGEFARTWLYRRGFHYVLFRP